MYPLIQSSHPSEQVSHFSPILYVPLGQFKTHFISSHAYRVAHLSHENPSLHKSQLLIHSTHLPLADKYIPSGHVHVPVASSSCDGGLQEVQKSNLSLQDWHLFEQGLQNKEPAASTKTELEGHVQVPSGFFSSKLMAH